MHKLYLDNLYLIYFIYGLVFFVMGFTVAIQVRNYSNLSNFHLAKKLWLLAAFGLIHGLAEWAVVFLPIQVNYLAPNIIAWLIILQHLIIVISYVFLFQFGILLINPPNIIIRRLPILLFGIWLLIFIYLNFFNPVNLSWLATVTETWTRYLFALPGSLISSYALFLQWRNIKKYNLRIASKFFAAAFVFGFYGIVAGFIVPPANFFPALLINTQTFFEVFGIPVETLRALSGMTMAYFVIGGLELFRIENTKQIEEAKRIKSIYEERGRISRDLHDGIIQSIYLVGLILENTLYSLKNNQDEAEMQVKESMDVLNNVVSDLRKYIMNLQPTNFSETDLRKGINNLLANYQAKYGIYFDVEIEGEQNFALAGEQCGDFYHIVQEAIINITKHSRATYAKVSLEYNGNYLRCSIKDNGQGFDFSQCINKHVGLGLKNMTERANAIPARLEIDSAKGRGTEVILLIDKCGDRNGTTNTSVAS